MTKTDEEDLERRMTAAAVALRETIASTIKAHGLPPDTTYMLTLCSGDDTNHDGTVDALDFAQRATSFIHALLTNSISVTRTTPGQPAS